MDMKKMFTGFFVMAGLYALALLLMVLGAIGLIVWIVLRFTS